MGNFIIMLGIAIWLKTIIIIGICVSLMFAIAFFLEVAFHKNSNRSRKESKAVIEKAIKTPVVPAEEKKPVVKSVSRDEIEIDLDAMLAKLEQKSKTEVKKPETKKVHEEVKEEIKETVQEKQEAKTETHYIKDENPVLDYSFRLLKVKDSLMKLGKDLSKNQKEINKFERTQNRKVRNEKLLNRKAAELTNLNLVLYNVNDIKNIDPDKKIKQEALVSHVAELKSSIKDADIFLASNKDKYNNSKKLNMYLSKEKTRYEEEIKDLEILIKKGK